MNLTINCGLLVLYAIRQNIRRFESLGYEAGRFDSNLPPVYILKHDRGYYNLYRLYVESLSL